MRILFVTTSTFLGGAEQNALTLISCLKEHEVKVISLYPLGEEFKNLNALSLHIGKWPTLGALIRLKKEIAAFKPHIVHAQMFKTIQMCRLLKDKSFKLITAPHTNYKNKNFLHVFLDRVLARNDDLSLAESESTFKFLIEHQKYKKEKVVLFANEAAHAPQESPAKRTDGKTVFITVARLNKEKGHKYLLSAFSELYKTNKNTALWLVGDGPEKENLLAMAHEGVTFFGEQKDVKKYLAEADVFVLPSLSESRPLALLEAKAARLPAIATNTGDNPLIYTHGKTGFIYNAKDTVLLTIFLKEMCNAEVRNKFKEELKNGTTVISDRYCNAYLGLVRQMAEEKK